MLDSTQAKRVIVHVGGDHVYRGKRAFIAIFEFLCRKKVVIPAITSSVAGFGADHHMHTINIERLAENLPVQVEFIATSDTVDEVLPELCEMVGTGLIEVQDTFLSVSDASSRQRALPPRRDEGKAVLLRVLVSGRDKVGGKPLAETVLECMRTSDIAGATVYRGVAGFGHVDEAEEGSLHLGGSDHPVTIVAVDEEHKIRAFLPFLDGVLSTGLVALSQVDVVRYTHNFELDDRRGNVR